MGGPYGAMRGLTINGRGFKVAHDGSGNKDKGGRNNEVAMNADNSFRVLQSVVPGQFGDLQVEIDDTREDMEFLQAISDAGIPIPVTATYASNISYTGDTALTGELKKDEQTGLMPITFQGGILQKV